MATVTISVPDELKQRMEKIPEANWSAIARKAIVERLILLEELDKKLSKSKLTTKDTLLLGRKIKSISSKKFLELE